MNVGYKDGNIILLTAAVDHIKGFCCSNTVRSQGILIDRVVEGDSTQTLSNDACSLPGCDLRQDFREDGVVCYIVKQSV